MTWYSAALVIAVVNERGGLWKRVTSVVLIRAADFDAAFLETCRVGRAMEETYANTEGERVRWAFERVSTLDRLPDALTSGTEIYSEPVDVDDPAEVRFDAVLAPERHAPGHSGVSPT